MNKYFGLVFFIFSSFCCAQEKYFGLYTNISTSDGHFSGFEVFYIPNSKVIFQEAEGWPLDPIILDIKSYKSDEYTVNHPNWGKIIFTFNKDEVLINFIESRYTQKLRKGQSFWQK